MRGEATIAPSGAEPGPSCCTHPRSRSSAPSVGASASATASRAGSRPPGLAQHLDRGAGPRAGFDADADFPPEGAGTGVEVIHHAAGRAPGRSRIRVPPRGAYPCKRIGGSTLACVFLDLASGAATTGADWIGWGRVSAPADGGLVRGRVRLGPLGAWSSRATDGSLLSLAKRPEGHRRQRPDLRRPGLRGTRRGRGPLRQRTGPGSFCPHASTARPSRPALLLAGCLPEARARAVAPARRLPATSGRGARSSPRASSYLPRAERAAWRPLAANPAGAGAHTHHAPRAPVLARGSPLARRHRSSYTGERGQSGGEFPVGFRLEAVRAFAQREGVPLLESPPSRRRALAAGGIHYVAGGRTVVVACSRGTTTGRTAGRASRARGSGSRRR